MEDSGYDNNCPFAEGCTDREGLKRKDRSRTGAGKKRPLHHYFGSGLITGAANDDPSNVAVFSQAGAQFGPGLLWTILFTYPLLTAVQEASARIGAVTGWGLSTNIRLKYGKGITYFVAGLSALANTVNLGADLGVMAAALQLLVSVSFGILLVGLAGMILILLVYIPYRNFVNVLKWLSLFLLSYPLTLFVVGGSWTDLFYATIRPHYELNLDFIFIFNAIIGTTISPYMMYWQAAEIVEDEIDQGIVPRFGMRPFLPAGFIRSMRRDTVMGMLFSQIPCWVIMAVAAQVFFNNGIKDIPDAAQAAKALEPLVRTFPHSGLAASGLFAVGIIGLGMLAVPVFAGSASYAVSGALRCRMGLYLSYLNAPCFYTVIIGATIIGLFVNLININPIKALIFASVFNGICSVPLIYFVARIARNRAIMGEHRSGLFSHVLVWLALGTVSISALLLIISIFRELG